MQPRSRTARVRRSMLGMMDPFRYDRELLSCFNNAIEAPTPSLTPSMNP